MAQGKETGYLASVSARATTASCGRALAARTAPIRPRVVAFIVFGEWWK
jgi:hypothetical protein